MIVKSTRVKVGGAKNLTNHILNKDENESVHVLIGDEEMAYRSDDTSEMTGRKYGNRHFTISPSEAITDAQIKNILIDLKNEYVPRDDFTGREILLIEHVKKRSDETRVPHYHFIISETDFDGRVLDNKMTYLKNEKIARLAEIRCGHVLTKGRHNRAVMHELRKEGKTKEAAAMEYLTKGPPAAAKFSYKAHQIAKRLGVDLAAVSHQLRDIDEIGVESIGEALADAEQNIPGLSFEIGDNGRDLVMRADDVFICSMNRMLKVKAENNDRLLYHKNAAQNAADLNKTPKNKVSYDKLIKRRKQHARAFAEGPEGKDDRDAGRNVDAISGTSQREERQVDRTTVGVASVAGQSVTGDPGRRSENGGLTGANYSKSEQSARASRGDGSEDGRAPYNLQHCRNAIKSAQRRKAGRRCSGYMPTLKAATVPPFDFVSIDQSVDATAFLAKWAVQHRQASCHS